MKALDAIGQPLEVGDTVVWAAGGRRFGLGLGAITEISPREVFKGWEVPPHREYVGGPWIPGVGKIVEVRANVKVEVDQRVGGRQGLEREDEKYLKVELPK